jgi:hypothetical protein
MSKTTTTRAFYRLTKKWVMRCLRSVLLLADRLTLHQLLTPLVPLSKRRGKILGNSGCLLPCHRGELKWGLNFGKYFEIHSINSRRSNGIQEKSKIFQILSFSPREKTKLVCSNSSKDWGSKNMLIFSWPNNQERLSKKT